MKKLALIMITAFAFSACSSGGGTKADVKKACINGMSGDATVELDKEQQEAFCGCFAKSAEENLSTDQMKQLTKAFESDDVEGEMEGLEDMEEEMMSSLKMCAMAVM